jgi:small subunit ribosomal protein S20
LIKIFRYEKIINYPLFNYPLKSLHFRLISVLKKLSIINYPLSIKFPYLCSPKIRRAMANHAATKKDVRQSTTRNERNRYNGKTTRNAIRDIKAVTDKKEADGQLPVVSSMIDKLAKRGIIHKNKAANLKRKLAKKVNALAK